MITPTNSDSKNQPEDYAGDDDQIFSDFRFPGWQTLQFKNSVSNTASSCNFYFRLM
jgi:hypothetical protein